MGGTIGGGWARGRWARAVAISSMTAVVTLVSASASGAVNQQISGADPFAGCNAGAGTGFNYPSTEVEPFVAVNPANHRNIIAVWQQDRFVNGGAHGLAAGVSMDGGRHFDTVALPFSSCTPGGLPYQRASDPWVSIGPDGIAYAISISVNLTPGGGTFNGSAVGVARSTDGGHTWDHTQSLIADTTLGLLNDKESITADPVKPGVAYAVWDRSTATDQPAYFAKTVDGGKTWSPAQRISASSATEGVIGDIIVVDPRNGTLRDFFDRFFLGPTGNFLGAEESFITSTDGGTSWSAPKKVADDLDVGVIDPFTGAVIRTGSGLADATIDPATGQLYLVWEDARFSNGQYDEVAFSTSTDGGATWSAPKRINTPRGWSAFTPMIAVNDSGTVAVSYYDYRTLFQSDPATLPTNYWLITSPRGGASFAKEKAIVSRPFDELGAPVSGGYFLGDYEGLAKSGNDFVSIFIKANEVGTAKNRTDAFIKILSPGDGSDVVGGTAVYAPAAPRATGGAQATSHTRAY